MEDLTKYYKTPARKGVVTADQYTVCDPKQPCLTNEFNEWKTRCIGKVILLRDFTGNFYFDPKCIVCFEKQEDLLMYQLTFEEYPVLNFKMVTMPVTAKSRKLNAKWTFSNE